VVKRAYELGHSAFPAVTVYFLRHQRPDCSRVSFAEAGYAPTGNWSRPTPARTDALREFPGAEAFVID
jgi:hypothetical protein